MPIGLGKSGRYDWLRNWRGGLGRSGRPSDWGQKLSRTGSTSCPKVGLKVGERVNQIVLNSCNFSCSGSNPLAFPATGKNVCCVVADQWLKIVVRSSCPCPPFSP